MKFFTSQLIISQNVVSVNIMFRIFWGFNDNYFFPERGELYMNEKKKTADYKIINVPGGNVYQFFCDLSGAMCARTNHYKNSDPEKELMIAWEKEGKSNFNLCHKCGRWVSDVMYNPDLLHCVRCSPIEDIPDYCPECGAKTEDLSVFCHKCGVRLMYGGEDDER